MRNFLVALSPGSPLKLCPGFLMLIAFTFLHSLKVVSATFLLVCLVDLKERTCETRKKFFYFF